MFTYLYMEIDKVLMPFYRLPDNPLLGYYTGTFALSLACVITGEYSIKLAFRLNKEKIVRNNAEMDIYQDLSIKALKAGDKAAYKACNSIANDAYGKAFFSQIALSASALWPVFIALGWMQYRFAGVEFNLPFPIPGIGGTVGYAATFLSCYIITRILSGKIKNKFLYLHKMKTMQKHVESNNMQLKSVNRC